MKGVQKRAKIYVKTIHDGMKLECDSCHKWFANNQSLAVHKKSVHEKIRINRGCQIIYMMKHTEEGAIQTLYLTP